MNKTYVISDIHAQYNKFKQVLSKANFDDENDTLIFLGDVCDRGDLLIQTILRLKRIKNLIFILGNHDLWLGATLEQYFDGTSLRFMHMSSSEKLCWITNGGKVTRDVLNHYDISEQRTIYEFLKTGTPYYELDVGDKKYGFVHGGIPENAFLGDVDQIQISWDRWLYQIAHNNQRTGYDRTINRYDLLFIGHTPTLSREVELLTNVIAVDCGAAYGGLLALVNIHNLDEIYYSDKGAV
jgi:serine/threonine protein phosphatase 1